MLLTLTNGEFAEIDEDDFFTTQIITFANGETWSGLISEIRWSCSHRPRTSYVLGSVRKNRPVTLHRLLLNAPAGMHVDHIDGN